MSDEEFMLTANVVDIDKTISVDEINLLLKNKNLVGLQMSDPLDNDSWKRINTLLLPKYPELRIRIYAHYDVKCDLLFLQHINNVKKLAINCMEEVKNVEYITKLKSLNSLEIEISSLKDFNFLYDLPNTIEKLSLGRTKSKRLNLKPLERFQNLRYLIIEGHCKNIEAIGTIVSIEKLLLRSISVENLNFLNNLKNLWSLDIKLGGIKDLSVLKSLNLKYLELWQIRGLSDISVISSLTNLQNLFLQSLRNVEVFPNISQLHSLKRVTLENMKGLNDISNLFDSKSLIEFHHISAENIIPETYKDLTKIPTLKSASVGFGSDKKNRILEKYLDENNIESYKHEQFNYNN